MMSQWYGVLMTTRYRVTCTFDFAPETPNLFDFDAAALITYLTGLGVPHDPGNLADGADREPYRLGPEGDGVTISWVAFEYTPVIPQGRAHE